MSRTGAALLTALGSALGLGIGIAGSRVATMHMASSETRANYVLLGAVLGAASGGAIASYAAAPKQLAP